MNATNLIVNFLVSLSTNYISNNKYAYTKYNNMILNLLYVLYKDGLISGYQISLPDKKVKVRLKYIKNKPLIINFKLINKPSIKIYSKHSQLFEYNKKFDYFFTSTSTGIMSSRQASINPNVGGQILFGIKLNNC